MDAVIFYYFYIVICSPTRYRSQHPTVPDRSLTSSITHVTIAFMNSDHFNRDKADSDWPLFVAVEEVRAQFAPGTRIMVAIGGWGDTAGFARGASTDEGRRRWAYNVASMIRDTGADGTSRKHHPPAVLLCLSVYKVR